MLEDWIKLTEETVKKKRTHTPTKAAQAQDPEARARELLKQTAGDRKKTAFAMKAEGYSGPEISAAFKAATGDGIGRAQWTEWEDEEKKRKEAAEVAGAVLTQEEKAWRSTVAARFRSLDERLQTYVMDFGCYVLEAVAPLVPADTAEEKLKKTMDYVRDAVRAFDPNALRELEKFGAAAFWAAQELKAQLEAFYVWADPSSRLQEMAEKALYSPNPINKDAFNTLLLELVKSIHGVPRFGRAERVSELPSIVKAYADARGISPEKAEAVMSEVVKEVSIGER